MAVVVADARSGIRASSVVLLGIDVVVFGEQPVRRRCPQITIASVVVVLLVPVLRGCPVIRLGSSRDVQ